MPTPARSSRSNTKTPLSQRSTSRQRSKTPARRSGGPSSIRSVRQTSPPPSGAQDTQAVQKAVHTEDTVRSTKRRRITPDVVTPATTSSAEISRPALSTRASRRRTASKVFTIAEDEHTTGGADGHLADQPQETSPLFEPQQDDQQKENETPKDSATKSIAPELDLQTTRSGRILLDPTTFPGEDAEEDEAESAIGVNETLPLVLESPSLHVAELSRTTGWRKPRRRESVDLERRRRSSTPAQPPVASDIPTLNSSQAPSKRPSSSKLALANRISKYSRLARTKKSKAQTPEPERETTPKDIEDGDASYQEESELEPEMPAAIKKTSKRPRKRRARSGSAQPSAANKAIATFPILTHRLANVSTLPTIDEEEDENPPLADATTNPSTERMQPNVVDVLAQICRETISNLVKSVTEPNGRSEKGMSKNKRTALEAFGKDLENELFTLSEAVENRITLEARVRKGKREKASLQSEYLELRKEREQIALRCDAVRRQHWECEEETSQKWTLSEAARRVEQEMERTEADEGEGLEFLLRSVTGTVSSASAQGGILDKVKSFNAHLETMALLLEGRDV